MIAISASGTPQELNGEQRAGATFRATQGRPSAVARSSASASRVRRALTAPVVAVVAATLALGGGGIALAASNGSISLPFTGHDHRSSKAPAAPATNNPGHTRVAGPHKSPEPSSTATVKTTPSPSLRGLCRAYQAGATHDGTKANPAFNALYAAAGGVAKVAAFCDDLIGPSTKSTNKPHATKTAEPTHPAKPTKKPHPTKPAKPTQAASGN